jgi:fibronectin-binding autotransporter adhesin
VAGTIFSGTYGNGVVLSDPATQNPATVAVSGYITNTASAGIALYGEAGFAWTVTNYGTVEHQFQPAVELASGGDFTNRDVVYSSSSVVGLLIPPPAIAISGGVGGVTNSGRIIGRVTLSGGTGTVTNSGRMPGGVYLGDGGSVTNAARASVFGETSFVDHNFSGSGPAVDISGAAGTVTNLGRIAGVVLNAGGTVTNGQRGSHRGMIAGPEAGELLFGQSQRAAVAISGPGTVTNFATMIGNPGIVIYGPGTVTNFGTILTPGTTVAGSAHFGVYLAGGGTLANAGSISGIDGGVVINGAGFLGNLGTIAATGPNSTGVYLGADGFTLVNSGVITGQYGIAAAAGGIAADTIVNEQFGSIAGYASGIVMDGRGYIGNSSAVAATGAGGIGVYLGANGVTLVNTGRIAGQYGIGVGAGDVAGNTIVNAGTIVGYGGAAIVFGANGDRLVVEPGAVFVGAVYAGVSDAIELAPGAGSLAGLGTNFAGFATVRIDPEASWDISGSGGRFKNDGTVVVDSALVFSAITRDPGSRGVIRVGNGGTAEFDGPVGGGQTVVFTDDTGTVLLDRPGRFHGVFFGFGSGDTVDLAGKQADGLLFGQQQLVLTEQGDITADLHFAGPYTASDFALSPDGNGGTDITFAAAASRAEFWTIKG